MKKTHLVIFLLLTLICCVRGDKVNYRELPASEIPELKNQPCAVIHVWATWCTICIKELPGFIKMVSETRRVNPVIIDVSSPFVQNNFSKKWLKTLAPPFETYLKPEGESKSYIDVIDKNWGGALPYTVLYDKGVKKKSWEGESKLDLVKKEILRICQ